MEIIGVITNPHGASGTLRFEDQALLEEALITGMDLATKGILYAYLIAFKEGCCKSRSHCLAIKRFIEGRDKNQRKSILTKPVSHPLVFETVEAMSRSVPKLASRLIVLIDTQAKKESLKCESPC